MKKKQTMKPTHPNPSENNPPGKKDDPVVQSGQQRKKKLVLLTLILAVPVAVFIYFIFFGLDAGKKENEQTAGLNLEIPDPKKVEIPDDKRKTYEAEQVNDLRKSKMQTLQDYVFDIKEAQQGQDGFTAEQAVENSAPAVAGNPVITSTESYREATRQINSFYQAPKTEKSPEVEALERQLAELKEQLGDKESNAGPLDMMEKSYQMAAKYLLPKEEKPVPTANGKTAVSVVKHREPLVSSLSNNYVPNPGFHTPLAGSNYADAAVEQNTIRACVAESQKLVDGSRVKLKILEDIQAGNIFIPRNHYVYGTVRIESERLDIQIPFLEYEGTIIPVELAVYDTDGQKGIHAPGSMEVSAAKEAVANLGQGAGQSISIARDFKQQLAMDATKTLIQAGSQYASKKARQVTVTVKANYQVLLVPKRINQ